MPNPTYSLENTIRFGAEDADRILHALGESPEVTMIQPVAKEVRDVTDNS